MKKLILVLLCLCFALSLGACNVTRDGGGGGGGEYVPGTAKGSISVICYEAGFGTAWLNEMASTFESATGNKVTVKKSYVSGALGALLDDNSSKDDIVMMLGSMYNAQSKGYMVELSDVYNTVPEGETKTIKEKVNPNVYSKMSTSDGKIFQMNWANPSASIVYNKTVLDRIFPTGYSLPRTTDELIVFAQGIAAKGVYPFALSTSVAYWDYAHLVWWAQYEGFADYSDYYFGYYNDNGTRKLAAERQNLMMTGRLRSLQAAETLLKKANNYTHAHADSMSWQESQIAFVGHGYGGSDMTECAMYVCGDWIENEVQSYLLLKKQELRMMKLPVISSITQKLAGSMNDATLGLVIDAIDKGETSYGGVSAADFAKIKEARSMVYSATFDHPMGIPASSKNKNLAKDFLVFMASDMGQSIFAKHTNGLNMPYGYVPSTGISDFVKSRYDCFGNNSLLICIDYSSPLVYRQGLSAYPNNNGNIDALLYRGTGAQKIIDDADSIYAPNWATIMAAAV